MTKKQLSSIEAFDIRQALHVAVLEALVSSRRWAPNDLVFQGGTSLHLTHGSPRFSEDLDFLVNRSLNLQSIGQTVAARLQSINWLPQNTSLSVSLAKEANNPHAFVVSVGGEKLIGSVRVKVELFKADPAVLSQLQVVVSSVRLVNGPGAGMQAFVPTASLHEIYADKVFAVAARPYLKARDVFDLHWLAGQGPSGTPPVCGESELAARLATYTNETAEGWLLKAQARLVEMDESSARVMVDLRRWLPSSWPMDEAAAAEMLNSSKQALISGMAVMRGLVAVQVPLEHDGAEQASPDDVDAP